MANRSFDNLYPYLERYLDNKYARENTRRAGAAIRDTYRRASRKGLKAPADRKFRNRLADSAIALREASDAIQHGRRRPRGQLLRRLGLAVLALGGLAVAALAANDELRAMVLGQDEGAQVGDQPTAGDQTPAGDR